eukprot:13323928-Alexandrium_andersonii.AAC.1
MPLRAAAPTCGTVQASMTEAMPNKRSHRCQRRGKVQQGGMWHRHDIHAEDDETATLLIATLPS